MKDCLIVLIIVGILFLGIYTLVTMPKPPLSEKDICIQNGGLALYEEICGKGCHFEYSKCFLEEKDIKN